jgi:hypothetical protein
MTKNVIVLDGQGNEYGATYPKRAKGLVKNGRARFIDENTICLACPPDKMEDTEMEHNAVINTIDTAAILSRIDQIIASDHYLFEAIAAVKTFERKDWQSYSPEDTRGHAIEIMVQCRETTNQQILSLLKQMYDDGIAQKSMVAEVLAKEFTLARSESL